MSFATKDQLQSLTAYMASQLNTSGAGVYSPVGTIISYMGTTAPADYLICDGTLYNIADYPMLANHFAGHFGSKNFFGGDGITTFAVPDLQGEFLRGTGTNGHENQGNGAAVGTHQDATTSIPVRNDSLNSFVAGKSSAETTPSNFDSTIGAKARRCYNAASSTTGGAEDYLITSRPTNTSVLYCIAYRDSFPAMEQMYSTEEKVVGRWIDGNTLYQKSFVNNSSYSPNATIVMGTLQNVDTVVTLFGVLRNSDNGNRLSIGYGATGAAIQADGTIYTTSPYSANKSIVTVQYTKTTDNV